MHKNVASQKFTCRAYDSTTGLPATGDAANITCKVAIDDGSTAAVTDTNPTELESGLYRFDLTQAETNGDKLEFIPVSSTSGIVLASQVIYTNPQYFADLTIESDVGGAYVVRAYDHDGDELALQATVGATNTALGNVTSGSTVIRANDGSGNALATASALSTVDGVADGIKAVTDNLPDSGALTTINTNTVKAANR